MSDSDSAGAFSPRYHRVILKLSGESLAHAGERGISMDEVTAIANQIKSAHALGCQIAVVVGGGNILRGAQFKGSSGEKIQEATAHYMGMLATVINALALQDALESIGIATRVMSAIKMDGVAEPFIRRRAIRHLEKGRIVILAAGTGAPFVTTDTCAANRGLELDADIVLKATRVDGVYSDDPEKNPHAILYRELDYDTVIEKNLKIMDSTAIAQCRTHKLPILVFNHTLPLELRLGLTISIILIGGFVTGIRWISGAHRWDELLIGHLLFAIIFALQTPESSLPQSQNDLPILNMATSCPLWQSLTHTLQIQVSSSFISQVAQW